MITAMPFWHAVFYYFFFLGKAIYIQYLFFFLCLFLSSSGITLLMPVGQMPVQAASIWIRTLEKSWLP